MESNVLRPIIMGLPIVTDLKYLRSLDSFQGNPPARPMTPFSAAATIRDTVTASDRDVRWDMRVEPVPVEREIVILEAKNIGDFRIQ